MQIKFEVASGIAVAATLLTALLGSSGSEALADTGLSAPTPVVASVAAETAPAQTVPSETVPSEADVVASGTAPAAPVVEVQPALAAPAPAPEAIVPGARSASLADHVRAHKQAAPLDSEMRCLAGAIYFEARGESLAGQLAVGRVVVERAQSGRFPASYCGVVFQRSQFSFVRGRSMPAISEGTLAWQRAVAIARIADADSWHNPADGALFFHATHVAPRWRLKRLAQVDNHIFYR
jgi:N-acetylmuramoyl-L-alanine amidase